MTAAARNMCALLFACVGATVVMRARLSAALVCIMAATCPALADPTASELAGRWGSVLRLSAKDCNGTACVLRYDLAPCGEFWCGVEVKADGICGAVAFQLGQGTVKQSQVEYSGSYQRSEGTQQYKVRASLYARPFGESPTGPLMLSIFGSTDGDFQPFRRSYPLHMLLSRTGDAVCRGQPKVS
jgi:hypothetical protein